MKAVRDVLIDEAGGGRFSIAGTRENGCVRVMLCPSGEVLEWEHSGPASFPAPLRGWPNTMLYISELHMKGKKQDG